MYADAEAAGARFAGSSDERITRVGHFIRKVRLDELPQLWNVLCGDMSLVGPRPDLPVQRSLYNDADWALRCSVRPGITGLAQVVLRSEGTEDDRRALDLRYVREHGVWLDLKILAATVGRLTGRGAN
jgi:lipopolysaccharide/colanic/teichoic acid biosynthesis glycosyltransferase